MMKKVFNVTVVSDYPVSRIDIEDAVADSLSDWYGPYSDVFVQEDK